MAKGGSRAIGRALADYLESLGGEIQCGRVVRSLDQLPSARAILLDLSPKSIIEIASDELPASYRRRLKILAEPIQVI